MIEVGENLQTLLVIAIIAAAVVAIAWIER